MLLPGPAMDEKPANSGSVWSEEDDAELRRRIAARQTAAVIAKGMRRRIDGIRGRAAALRLTLPSSQRPWRLFPGRASTPATETESGQSPDGGAEGDG